MFTNFEDTATQTRLARVARICLAITLLIGLSGFFGWLFDIRFLRRPFAQFVAINPLTAVLFLIAVTSQPLVRGKSHRCRTAGIAAGFFICAAATLKLLELSGVTIFSVDRILFSDLLETERLGNIPNRMAPNTAFCFFWLGISIVLQPIGQRGAFFPAQFTLLPLVLAASLSILGYLYGVPKFYGISHYIPMALHTAAGLLFISAAIIAAYPRQGILRHFTTTLAGSKMARWLIPGTILVPILLGFLRLFIDRQFPIPVEFGVSILVLGIITILSLLVWFDTRTLNLKDTKERLAQAELAQLNENLERLVNQRTAAVLKTETRLQQVLDNMLEGIQIIGHNWKYLYVNEALVKQAAMPRNRLIGFSVTEIFPGVEGTDLFHTLRRAMIERIALHLETPFQHPDGRLGWYEMSIQPVPEGVFILTVDITERRQADEIIKKANEELEFKVMERTQELETLNHELESFSYSVSHDLRAPLRIISGYARILEETSATGLSDNQKTILQNIRGGIERMDKLIDDLLKFSMLGTSALQKSPVDMNRLVAEVIGELHNREGEKILIVAEPLEPAEGDYMLLRQVFTNLISNAIKYSNRQANPVIKIRSRPNETENIYSVSDNGAGFDMAYADKLFGVFQRLHSAKEYAGTGVGLAIVQRIVHRHGGRVWAVAEPDQGATFSFSLPVGKIS